MNKLLTLLMLTLCSTVQSSNTYLEYKNEKSVLPIVLKDIHRFRIGETMTYKNLTLYVELGTMTNGYSYETGYKYRVGNFVFKGKYEEKDSGINKSKLQTEIRYTFE